MVLPPHTGTCASLPVLIVAVGKKLGYPVKLVPTHNHLFARWESRDGKERFNIESTNGGMGSHPDEHYTEGQYAWNGAVYDGEGFLKSMTPQQELADFLEIRAMCLRMNKRFSEAAETYQLCVALKPESQVLAVKLRYAKKEEETGRLTSN